MNAPTIGFNLRLPIELYEALERMAGSPRGKTRFVLELLRREAARRGALAGDARATDPGTPVKTRRRRRT